jgi:amino acid transporter
VFLWIPLGLALLRLRPSRTIANNVFLLYMAIVVLVIASAVYIVLRDGHSANPAKPGDFTTFNFSLYGSFFGLILLNYVGIEAPFNMGAEVIESRRTLTKMVVWGTVIVVLGYILTSTGILLATPIKDINATTGAVQVLSHLHVSGIVPIVALLLVLAFVAADLTYQQTYSRLIFVSGLERHLPRIFTHLNPRTRNPVTALLFTGALVSIIIVVVYSQQSLHNAFLTLEGALTIMWLLAGLFFFIPVLIARRRYAERYRESFWRIPGGNAGAWTVVLLGLAGTAVGIYYTYIEPFSSSIKKSTWILDITVVCVGLLLLAAIVFVLGRRAGAKQSEDELLASMLAEGRVE